MVQAMEAMREEIKAAILAEYAPDSTDRNKQGSHVMHAKTLQHDN